MDSGGLSHSLVNQLVSSTALALKVVAKKPPRKFSSRTNTSHHMLPLYIYLSKTLFVIYRLTAITQLVHHGMLFVPIGYTFGAGMFEMENVKGGSPYGAGTFAGDGSRQPTELELEQAFHQGKYIATITKKLKGSTA